MINGVLYRYDNNKKVGDLMVRQIRKNSRRIFIYTDQGVRIFKATKDKYTEKELLGFLK